MGGGESTGDRGVEDLTRLPPAIGGVHDGDEGDIGFAHGRNIIQERPVTGSSLTPTLQGFSPSTPFLQGPRSPRKRQLFARGLQSVRTPPPVFSDPPRFGPMRGNPSRINLRGEDPRRLTHLQKLKAFVDADMIRLSRGSFLNPDVGEIRMPINNL